MKELLENNKWYILPSILFFMGLYDWLILDDFRENQLYGSIILFIIVYFL
jgi:ATP/ADP translocase